MTGFPTAGKEIYHLQPATIATGVRAIVAAAHDGTILAYSPQGVLLWQNRPSEAFPFNLAVSDIDGDGLDETLVAYSDGIVHALDHDGKSIWRFESGEADQTPPLYQVCAVRSGQGTIIFTGGVSQKLFALSPKGALLGTRNFAHPIRHLTAGRFLDRNHEALAMMTTSKGLNGDVSLFVIAPETQAVKWKKADICRDDRRFRRCFSMIALDLDGDGYDEIAFSHNWDNKGKISLYSRDGECITEKMDDRIPNIQYRMNLLCGASLPGREYPFILGFYGNEIIRYEKDGSIRESIAGKYSHACGTFDSSSGICYLGSDISGGDGIYLIDMKEEEWHEAFRRIRSVGTLAALERNLAALSAQIARFTPPPYQPFSRRINLTVDERLFHSFGSFKNIRVLACVRYNQQFERQDELWNRHIDNHYKYNIEADEIIEAERRLEKAGIHHTVRINHQAAIYASPRTLERILESAPNTFYAFEFAEMANLTDDIKEVVLQIMLPLAEACLKYRKHIILQNKTPFWIANCYADFWKRVLMDGKYRSVFLPSVEETNSGNQEMSIAGRIGLWKAGLFATPSSVRFSLDNPCYDRMWEWSTQQNYCHFLRQGAFSAALGINHFDIAYSQGMSFLNTATPAQRDSLDAQFVARMMPVFALLDSGVIQIPESDDLLSVSDCALGMQSPLSEEYMTHAVKLNHYDFNESRHEPQVLDRCDCYWGGAPVLPHDFTYYAMNSRRRMLNFLPVTPYGMVPIMPAETNPRAAGVSDIIRTDGKSFLDEQGCRHDPAAYKPVVVARLEQARARLPVIVEGDAAWSVVRLDPAHVRVLLVDPGYLTPADRDVTVVLQHLPGIRCEDILAREALPIASGRIRVRVPMGTLRVLDITHG